MFRADRDRESLIEDVLDEADDEELLFEDRQHLSHGLDAVEDLGDARGAADEDLLALHDRLLGVQDAHGFAHECRPRGRDATVPARASRATC